MRAWAICPKKRLLHRRLCRRRNLKNSGPDHRVFFDDDMSRQVYYILVRRCTGEKNDRGLYKRTHIRDTIYRTVKWR